VRSSNAVGIDGHQWSLHCAPEARLPCRVMCECGWTSTAGQRTGVLLELKGHLEEALSDQARPSSQDADSQHIRERRAGWPSAGPAPHQQGGDNDDL